MGQRATHTGEMASAAHDAGSFFPRNFVEMVRCHAKWAIAHTVVAAGAVGNFFVLRNVAAARENEGHPQYRDRDGLVFGVGCDVLEEVLGVEHAPVMIGWACPLG